MGPCVTLPLYPPHMSSVHGLPGIGRIGLVLPTGTRTSSTTEGALGVGREAGGRRGRPATRGANHEGAGDHLGTFDMIAELARHAERTGFDALWVEDGAHQELEACSVLGALAMVVVRPSLGVLVADPFRRHPSMLAKQVTTVDVLAGGRAVLGIAPPTGPARQFAEVLQVVRALFTVDAPTWTGQWYRLAGAANRPPPTRPGGCPVLVGPVHNDPDATGVGSEGRPGDGADGGSPSDDVGLELAARYADGVIFAGGADGVARAADRLSRWCQEVGRNLSGLTLLWAGDVEAGPSLGGELRSLVDAGIQGFAVRITPRRAAGPGSSSPAVVLPDPDDMTVVAGALRGVVGCGERPAGATGRSATDRSTASPPGPCGPGT